MTTVTIQGALAVELGRSVWHFEISTPMEAFRALEAVTGKCLAFLHANARNQFRVLVDDKDIYTPEEFSMIRRRIKSLQILPVLEGAGNPGGWLALICVAIIAAVLFLPSGGYSAGWAALWAGNLSFASSLFLTVGLALTLSGVSALLYGTPKDQEESPENRPSYIFNGPVNAYRQGNPIPVGFGGMRIGSQVISAGIRSIDIPVNYNEGT